MFFSLQPSLCFWFSLHAVPIPLRRPHLISTDYIENKGSDTIVNLALAWAETYQAAHPAVRISVTGGGSGTGIAALINKTADIANASRQIKEEEIAAGKSQRR